MQLLSYDDANYFNPDNLFTHEEGLMFAVQIIDLTATGIEVPQEIGSIRIQEWKWGTNENGDYFDYQKPLKKHICSDEELGLVDNPKRAHLFPLGKGQPDKVKKDYIWCVDEDDLVVYGSYSSGSGRMINVALDKCIGHDYCLSEKEITNWFRGKYIFLRMNRIRFDAGTRGDGALIKESFGQWVPVMSSAQIEVPFLISRSSLQLQDFRYNFDILTEKETDAPFEVNQIAWRAYEQRAETIMIITLEHNLDLRRIERSYYTFVDVLSDVGGLQGIQNAIATFLIGLFYRDTVREHLITRLYDMFDGN